MLRRTVSRALRAFALLAASLAAPACVSVDGPEAGELDAARSGDQTIALFRVIVTSNAGPVSPFEEAFEAQCMSVGLTNPAYGGRVTAVDTIESFSDETLSQGWVYFVLPPGKHAVAINPPRMYDPRSEERWIEAAHWQFDIPEDTPVVYIGSIRAHCRAEPSDFGGVRVREIRAQKIRNESAAATAIAAAHLPDLPPPKTLATKRMFARESSILSGVN